MYGAARTSRLPRGSAAKLPVEYVEALKRTPRGLSTLDRLAAFASPEFKTTYEVTLVDDPLPGGAHGVTYGDTSAMFTEISRHNAEPNDRMYKWSAEEIVNIVGVHEAQHVVLSPSSADQDYCYCLLCPLHHRIIFNELVARLQYSLIHPADSTPKAGWLDRYVGYFAKALRLQATAKYRDLCDEFAAKAGKWNVEAAALKVEKYEKDNPPEGPFDTAAGMAQAHSAYLTALEDMEVCAGDFAKRGSFTDKGPYKRVLASMDEYRADTGLLLLV